MKLLVLIALSVAVTLADDDNNLRAFRDSNREFSEKLYKELMKGPDDFVVSPLSAEIALALVHEGAAGETAKQLAAGLSLPADSGKVTDMIKAVLPELHSSNQFKFNLVNKLYLKDDFAIKDKFNRSAVDIFKSAVEHMDVKKKQETVAQINNWVAESTENNINNLITPSEISESTVAVILNAIYFQATWLKQFYPESTQKGPFYTSTEKSVDVDMMDKTSSFGYFECSELNAKFLKMGYVGNDLSMVVALPNAHDGLSSLENNIAKVFEEKEFEYKKVHVQFPKFSMDYKIELIPILRNLGVVNLFEPYADLSGISDKPLMISGVVQKTTIEVNEKGTIAASATAAIVGLGAAFDPSPPIDFIANRPFTYFIQSPIGIIFTGRFTGKSL